MEKKTILKAFSTIPDVSDLKCTTCELYPSDVRTLLSFHCLYICRFLLTEFSDILVAPNNVDNTITIVSAKNDCISKKIELIPMLKDNLRILDEKVLSDKIYDDCLSYSILTKLSPAWIKVDKYFIRSEDFISYNQSPNAVEVGISRYSEKLLLLQLSSVVLKFESYFEPGTSTPKCWNRYNESKTGCINLYLSQQVYVLPSMKSGNIISISKSVVDGSCIREDWLNQHGYLLPDENELSYCKVKHLGSGQEVAIYPSTCLLAKPLEIVSCSVDSRNVIASFLRTLIVNNETICGETLELMGTKEMELKYGIQNIEEQTSTESTKTITTTEQQEFEAFHCVTNFHNPEESQSTQSTNDKNEIAEVRGTPETDGTNENFEWEECNECSQIGSCTQNFDTLVSVPFDLDSIKSVQYPTSTTRTPDSSQIPKKRFKYGESTNANKTCQNAYKDE